MRLEMKVCVGPTLRRSSPLTTSTTRSRSSGKRVSSVVSHWYAMRCSSSKTRSTHCRPGCSSRAIWRLTSMSKLISGTKSDGRGPLALAMTVRMSSSLRPSKGSSSLMARAKISLKMKLMRAPPCSSHMTSAVPPVPLPSMPSWKCLANLESSCSSVVDCTDLDCASAPSPSASSSCCTETIMFMSFPRMPGSVSRMCTMSTWLSMRASTGVVHLSIMLR
mmetsp:Transcript_8486/g.28875  ORF Transcript_8486/g.28875 Transcript_8486/m.28875 type:complete len:220 (-) Transcript_8486:871-1530(-)